MASKKIFGSAVRKLQAIGRTLREDTVTTDTMHELFESLNQRLRPEDVAQLILDDNGTVESFGAKAIQGKCLNALHAAARSSYKELRKQHPDWYSSMSQDFRRVDDMSRQAKVAGALFNARPPQEVHDPVKMKTFISKAGREIEKKLGHSDFLHDRLDRKHRRFAGITISKRQYNKRFRLLKRMENKVKRMETEHEKRTLTMISKSRLACQLTFQEFAKDRTSAYFIAYITARQNLRSEFTCGSQERAYDTIAEQLMELCKKSKTTNWWAIAYALPDSHIVKHLTEQQKGELLAKWYGVMERLAILLRRLWQNNKLRRETMIVKRGDDSSTWNVMAGAWNKSREGWFSVLHEMGMDSLTQRLCPGKVMRLMAADVAAWHRASGGDLDPNTKVWSILPLPWDVVLGKASCTKAMVVKACQTAKMEAKNTGWCGPRGTREAVDFKPTPELVHGVTIGNPGLATILKKAGWFSGKPGKFVDTKAKPVYDTHGFAIGVEAESGKKRKVKVD